MTTTTHGPPARLGRLRLAAPLAAVAVLALGASGCMKIHYGKWIEERPSEASTGAIAAPIAIDYQASYVEVASDVGKQAIPSARYDRVDLLSAVADRWNAGAPTDQRPQDVRVAIFANIDHQASDTAGATLHSIFGVTLLMGLPWSCGYGSVTVAVQNRDGTTLVAKGSGKSCSGLYYPHDHVMAALANALGDALTKLQPVHPEQLRVHVPRLPEIPNITNTIDASLNDRVVWWAQETKAFPAIWGADE